MGLPIAVETRTGDTPQNRRASGSGRGRRNLLLTTPESLALLLSIPTPPTFFAGLRAVIVDEVHALAGTKRGDQLALVPGPAGDAGAGGAPGRAVGHGRPSEALRCSTGSAAIRR